MKRSWVSVSTQWKFFMVQPGNGSRPEKCPLSSCIAISLRDKSAYCSILSFIHSQPTHDNLFWSLKFLVFQLKWRQFSYLVFFCTRISILAEKLPITHCKYSLIVQLVFSQMGSFNYPSDKSQLDERIRQRNCTMCPSVTTHRKVISVQATHVERPSNQM